MLLNTVSLPSDIQLFKFYKLNLDQQNKSQNIDFLFKVHTRCNILIMGILKLMDFLKAKAPKAITPRHINQYKEKTMVIDASNWIYQFLIKTQTIKGNNIQMPVDWMGNQTGHLIGMLSRVELCFANKITPVWVFDGKPPQEKKKELDKRKKNKQKAENQSSQIIDKIEQRQKQMEENFTLDEQLHIRDDLNEQSFDLLKFSKRSVKISQQEIQDAKKLIRLIGLPVIEAPSQAEPQCASIIKQGLAYATISEDMDNLAFGCHRMVRYFNQKKQCSEINLQQALEQLEISYEQFVDFCILCGCDYTSKIKNIGPVKAYNFIKQYGSIEGTMQQIVQNQKFSKKFIIPDDFNHLRARSLFFEPKVTNLTKQDLQQTQFQKDNLITFLKQKQFSLKRIENWISRMKKTNIIHID